MRFRPAAAKEEKKKRAKRGQRKEWASMLWIAGVKQNMNTKTTLRIIRINTLWKLVDIENLQWKTKNKKAPPNPIPNQMIFKGKLILITTKLFTCLP